MNKLLAHVATESSTRIGSMPPSLFEADVELLPSEPAQDQYEPFSKSLPRNLMAQLDRHVAGVRGKVACSTTRINFMQLEDQRGYQTKPDQLLDIPYDAIKHYYVPSAHQKIAILACHQPTRTPRRHYESFRFQSTAQANEFLDTIDQFVGSNSLSMKAARQSHQRPPLSYSSTGAQSQATDSGRHTYALKDEVQFCQLDMRCYREFPERLPSQLQKCMAQTFLDVRGTIYVYKDKLYLKALDKVAGKPTTIYATQFDRVKSLYRLQGDDRHGILAVEEDLGMPHHYAVFRFNNITSLDKMIELFEQGSTLRKAHAIPSSPETSATLSSPLRKSQVTTEYRAPKLSDNSLSESYTNRHLSLPPTRRTRHRTSTSQQSPARVTTESGGGGGYGGDGGLRRSRSFFQVSSVRSRLPSTRSSTGEYTHLQDELNAQATSHDWDSELIRFRSDSKNGVEVAPNGPIYLYVAHRLRPRYK